MNKYAQTASRLLAAAALSLSLPLLAQATMDHSKPGMDPGKMGMTAAPGMTDGEIRKIDKENGKVTIKHGEIKHMDMPPMSMVFNVKDKAMLDKVQVGEKIQFIVIQDAGKMVVTDIKAMK
ncbi:copper-binding protein [Hydrogenophaga sp.]|uniref:copper-binding protein n=1 Tax=Hydrogenophaga sp. TaxID=1904254 RepID=UPI0025C6957B|nr:copper-binding protein [Hydrogenophaga sp.]MBT9463449.1 copper-binding protein [Hydrogenophaga sp.]